MKSSFPSFYRLTEQQYKTLWEEAIIVFDTNVLLNLYRYQEETRKEVLEVITSLKERLWIPYHVGLEFQRNRLDVILEQHSKFDEVRAIIKSSINELSGKLNSLQLPKRHSLIKPDKIIDDIRMAEKGYLQSLDTLEKGSLESLSNDSIRETIDALFEKKVGTPPESQAHLDKSFLDAETRFKKNIPPGFKDVTKEEDSFTHSGLVYKKCFGDFIIWQQLIEHVRSTKVKSVIFVTDDSKADWWKIVKGKNLGIHPELTGEMQAAGATLFHGYNMLSFLKYAKEHLNADVTLKAMGDVEGTQRRIKKHKFLGMQDKFISQDAEEAAIFNWVHEAFEHVVEVQGSEDLDYIVAHHGKKCGISVKIVRNPSDLERIMRRMDREKLSPARSGLDCNYDLIAFANATTGVIKKFISHTQKYPAITGIELIIGEFSTLGPLYENRDQPLKTELRFSAVIYPHSYFEHLF